jgi:hypothetical protein
LTGASIQFDTYCSSALVALNSARQSLLNGEGVAAVLLKRSDQALKDNDKFMAAAYNRWCQLAYLLTGHPAAHQSLDRHVPPRLQRKEEVCAVNPQPDSDPFSLAVRMDRKLTMGKR